MGVVTWQWLSGGMRRHEEERRARIQENIRRYFPEFLENRSTEGSNQKAKTGPSTGDTRTPKKGSDPVPKRTSKNSR